MTMTRFVEYNHGSGEINIRTDIWLWLIPLILSGIGILMVTSTTSNTMYAETGSPFTLGVRQARSFGVGFAMMLLASRVSVNGWRRLAPALWVFSVALTCVTCIPGIGAEVNGARRWLRLGPLSFQPSELMILAVVLEAAKIFEKFPSEEKKCMVIILIIMGISAIPLIFQRDFGTTVMLAVVCMGMLVERFRWKYPLAIGVMLTPIAALLVYMEDYRVKRVLAFLNPLPYRFGDSYQITQSLIAFANGEVWGAGLGHGLQKLHYLPEVSTDFIYAMLGEELGLLGTMGVIVLFAFWVFRCRILYKRARDGFETAVIWGVTLTTLMSFFINIGGVTKLIPLTGMPLPFISYGGSALFVAWMRVGVLLRIHKNSAEAAL
jgi:cell division protein FtsW